MKISHLFFRSIAVAALAALSALFLVACSDPASGDDTGKYTITIVAVDATGVERLDANQTQATEGEAITLTATLGPNRKVGINIPGITVTSAVITTSGGTSTFIMPATNVVITAKFF